MKTSRRAFFGRFGQATGAVVATGMFSQAMCRRVEALVGEYDEVPAPILAGEESFWRQIQQAYTTDRSLVNLNNGGVSPSPRAVQEALDRYLKTSNLAPTHYMWGILEKNKELVRRKLARLAGADPEEVAITRNATESLENILFGLDLEAGDEVLTTTQDYPNMVVSLKQREKRNGIVLKQVSVPTPPDDLDQLVEIFRRGITDRTKLILVCHMVNLTGQIFPIRKICDMAHARGIDVLVDGAHTFAHLDYDIPSLGCDYFGTSLHKWLSAPFGTGLLWVKKDKIPGVWPLFGHQEPDGNDIRKFERIGTHPVPNFLAIGEALNFHNAIGSYRKQERLRYLKNYWAIRALEIPGVSLNTRLDADYSCGVANFKIEGIEPPEIVRELKLREQVITTVIGNEECRGVRVTPHVYTTLEDLDLFLGGVRRIAKGS